MMHKVKVNVSAIHQLIQIEHVRFCKRRESDIAEVEQESEEEDWDAEIAAEQKVKRESEEVVATSPEQKDEVEWESEKEDWDAEVAAEQKAKRESDIVEADQESEEEDWDVEVAAEQKARRESEEVVATSPEQKDEVEDWDVEVAAE